MKTQFIKKASLALSIAIASTGLTAKTVSIPDLPVVPASALSEQSTKKITAEDLTTIAPMPSQAVSEFPLTPEEEAAMIRAKKSATQPEDGKVVTLKRVEKADSSLIKKANQSPDTEVMAEKHRKPIETKLTLTAEAGVNQFLDIAVGHPNRIVTPFSVPRVMKVDKSTVVDVRENVLYIATTSQSPVTMFVRESGTEANVLSLTLVPKRIPPREISIEMKGQNGEGSLYKMHQRNEVAKKWEESGDYVGNIRSLMRGIATNEVPRGYRLRALAGAEMPPYCNQGGLGFDFSQAQVLDGHHLQVVIGVVENTSKFPIEMIETTCGSFDVRAVVSWPHSYLQPGMKSEVFIARSKEQRRKATKVRPSLIK